MNTRRRFPWQHYANHDRICREVLTACGCMDSRGRIRRWRPEAVKQLAARGVASLDADKCADLSG